jgi:hypothetical protein
MWKIDLHHHKEDMDWRTTVNEVQRGLDMCLCDMDLVSDELVGAIYKLRHLLRKSKIDVRLGDQTKSGGKEIVIPKPIVVYEVDKDGEIVPSPSTSTMSSLDMAGDYRIDEMIEKRDLERAIKLSLEK